MQVEAGTRTVRVRRGQARAPRLAARRAALAAVLVLLVVLVVGIAFAGSPDTLAKGVRVAGVDVGGLRTEDARRLLARRADAVANVPVTFTAGGKTFALRPTRLGSTADWRAAVDQARSDGDGFLPFRGLRRLQLRLSPVDVVPPARAWNEPVSAELDRIARAVDRPHRDAAVVRRGLHVSVAAGHDGRVLDRPAARKVIVSSLASLKREPVALPVRDDPQRVTASSLDDALADARTALSAPVRLSLGQTRWRIPRWRIAKLLALPAGGETEVRIGGPAAKAFFARLAHRVNRPPSDADWALTSGNRVRLVPARDGRALDVSESSQRLLAAVLSPDRRVARLPVAEKAPARTTAQARAMGITGVVASYETIYGGDANRIHNVQLVARLIDRKLIAPGSTFSFNATTGERNAAKGFREAPVIINGELQTGLGGGVCQVSTTVFNAAYEAGLAITERTNHALYISHYPLGRDATVNYPDTDLKFVNDTGHWLLLRTFVGPYSLQVSLLGTPVHRRVVSEVAPLDATGPVPVKALEDPTLPAGERVTEETGVPPQRTSVHRRVYGPSGRLLHDDTWTSAYVGEPTVVHVGTKPKPKPTPKTDTSPPPTEREGDQPSTTDGQRAAGQSAATSGDKQTPKVSSPR